MVDLDGFDEAMQRQREMARANWAGSGEAATARVWFEIREREGASEFLGYETVQAEARIVAIVVDGEETESAGQGAEAMVVANQTPFYGEAGGQVGDVGDLKTAAGAEFLITDTKKQVGDLTIHVGRVESGAISVGDEVELRIDDGRRERLRGNHSATHLLHEALRRELGQHVTQKGSLVAPDRLRFDISHPKPVTREALAAVEADVNRQIRANREVTTRLMDPEQAVSAGALALFGEKYGEEVRVVSMGEEGDGYFSTELCGGTHVGRTGDIGAFKIVVRGAGGRRRAPHRSADRGGRARPSGRPGADAGRRLRSC